LKGEEVQFPPKYFSVISDQAKDLIRRMLTFSVKDRPSAREAIGHEWISTYASSTPPSSEVLNSVLTNIKGFASSAKLKDAIHCFIATQLIASKETKELTDAFMAMDVNGDGRLSKEEMLAMYTTKMGKDRATDEVEQIMS
jgi:calcium-dependent protein kinase